MMYAEVLQDAVHRIGPGPSDPAAYFEQSTQLHQFGLEMRRGTGSKDTRKVRLLCAVSEHRCAVSEPHSRGPQKKVSRAVADRPVPQTTLRIKRYGVPTES